MTAGAVTVRRARVGPRWAATPGRERLQRCLADIDLARHGLPPQAILIVRRLQASAAAFHGGDAEPLNGALRGVLGAAIRPAREALVGAGVAAVWFADEAELLACLARDVLADELAVRWWWPLLFGRAATPAGVMQRWVAAPRAVPWALRALSSDAPAGQGRLWLEHIGPVGRAAILQALVLAYPVAEAVRAGVESPGAEMPCEPSASGGRPGAGSLTGAGDGALADEIASAQSVVKARWSVGPITPGPGGAELLLRLAEVLCLAPQRAANPALLAELQWAAAALPASSAGAKQRLPRTSLPSVAATQAGVRNEQGQGRAGRQPALVRDGKGAALPSLADAEQSPRAAPPPTPPAPPPVHAAQRGHPALVSAQPRAVHAASLDVGSSFDTQFGGLAFLLNVALNLGLYGDFTQPQQAGLLLSPWRLLHTALVAGCGAAGRKDALAHWLWARARAGEGAAAEIRLKAPWQLPAAALRAFDAETRAWHAVADGEVLQLWHPAGFCVAHQVPVAGLPALLAGLQRPPPRVLRHERRGAPAAPRVCTLVWPLLRARLALALGLPARAAVARCLWLPARVQARAERLDLHFSLNSLPISLRLAGLDRDPGWLPAAGSDIRFHFD